jgi:hypothetical protein
MFPLKQKEKDFFELFFLQKLENFYQVLICTEQNREQAQDCIQIV